MKKNLTRSGLLLTAREKRMHKAYMLIILIMIVWYLPGEIIIDKALEIKQELEIKPVQAVAPVSKKEEKKAEVKTYEVIEETIREITAYNVGDINQTDSTPCTSANGENICLAVGLGYKRCAANFVNLGTRLYIEKFGECLVTDRMNPRFENRVDSFFMIPIILLICG